jgi:putative phosphoribosyl transferase
MSLETEKMKFKDRHHAGAHLAHQLAGYGASDFAVLVLPPGGVAVGFEVSRILHAPLDTVVTRAITVQHTSGRVVIGAISPGDVIMIDNTAVAFVGVSDKEIEIAIAREKEEMERRIRYYRSGFFLPRQSFETIAVVDDGTATSITLRAAVESVKLLYKPQLIIFASPVCLENVIRTLEGEIKESVCLEIVDDMTQVACMYSDFHHITDGDVVTYLRESKRYKELYTIS